MELYQIEVLLENKQKCIISNCKYCIKCLVLRNNKHFGKVGVGICR